MHGRGINGGPDSDSGLSGFGEMDDAFKRDGRESKTESAVDSGRRSQSLENLSEDLASVSLASPVSSPSPMMASSESAAGKTPTPTTKGSGHVHFVSGEAAEVPVHRSSDGLNHVAR